MSYRTVFNIDVIDSKTPINQDPFYDYIVKNVYPFYWKSKVCFFDTVDAYLKTKGFDIKKHKVDPVKFDILESIFKIACIKVPLSGSLESIPFNELFVESNKHSAFTVYLEKGSIKVEPTQKLLNILKVYDFAYPLDNHNMYFKMVNNALFIQYQFIIGSCKVCNVELN